MQMKAERVAMTRSICVYLHQKVVDTAPVHLPSVTIP